MPLTGANSKARAVVYSVLRTVGERIFAPCKIPNCTGHSLGLVCTECGRTLCNFHAVVTLPPKSQVTCVSCIVEDHPELFAEDGDPNVIEAEVVEDAG